MDNVQSLERTDIAFTRGKRWTNSAGQREKSLVAKKTERREGRGMRPSSHTCVLCGFLSRYTLDTARVLVLCTRRTSGASRIYTPANGAVLTISL